jgi:hypothetical protein
MMAIPTSQTATVELLPSSPAVASSAHLNAYRQDGTTALFW